MFPQKYFIMAPLYQWMNSWNSVSDFSNIANHEEVTNQQNLFIKEKKGTYYYVISLWMLQMKMAMEENII